jgi:hypothetical protein
MIHERIKEKSATYDSYQYFIDKEKVADNEEATESRVFTGKFVVVTSNCTVDYMTRLTVTDCCLDSTFFFNPFVNHFLG